MRIEEKALTHWIDNFYGYGSWDAKIWFIGYEEGGGEMPEDVAERIQYFAKAHPTNSNEALCNVRELYKDLSFRWEGPKTDLYATHYEYRFGPRAVQHTVWKNLTSFVRGYRNLALPDMLSYQQTTFLSPQSQEALIQLYPLPSPHNHAWYYSWLDVTDLPFLKTRQLYQDHVYPNRIQHILSQMQAYKPEIVLMYGMNNINTLKKSVGDFFNDTKFRPYKAIKQQIPQHHLTNVDTTTLIITTQIPALRHNRVETGFDWYEFGNRILTERASNI